MKSLFKLAAGAALGAMMAVSAHAEAVKIAFIDPLSGPFATTGTNGLAEWEFAVEELVNKKIPENSKEIGVAREHGDLRENFEFKAAKQQQAVLMRQIRLMPFTRDHKFARHNARALVDQLVECMLPIGARLAPDDRA